MMRHSIAYLVGVLGFIGFGSTMASGETYITGDLTTDQIWTVAGSPYILEGDVILQEDLSLVVEPGVEVRMRPGSQLVVMTGCNVTVVGTADQPILFTSDSLDPQPGDYIGLTLTAWESSTELAHCIIEYGIFGLFIEVPVTVHDVEIRHCLSGLALNVVNGAVGGFYIHDCESAGVATIGPTTVAGNTIIGNAEGGVAIFEVLPQESATVNGNDLIANGDYDLIVGYSCRVEELDATYNWWGTPFEPEIAARVYDRLDNPELHTIVNWIPFLYNSTDAPDRPVPSVILHAAAPNPFNPRTTIRFSVAHEQRITIDIYDLAGRLIRPLAEREFPAGEHRLDWDGHDAADHPVAAGVYVLRLRASDRQVARKITLVR